MKKILLTLGVLLLTSVSLPGETVERPMPASLLQTSPSISANEVLTTVPAPQLQLAAISEPLGVRSGNLRDANRPAADRPSADSLPSTPVALACLLLMICILVGRRNGQEHVE
jgi:hypothetical protein